MSNDLYEGLPKLSVFNLTDFQKRSVALSHVAEGHKIRLYEYDNEIGIDSKKNVGARKMSLGISGRDGRAAMTKHIEDLAESVGEEEFSKNIIQYSLEAIENIYEELETTKNAVRRRQFLRALDNSGVMTLFVVVGIISAGKHCVKNNIELNHKVLELTLRNADENKTKISRLFSRFNKDEITSEVLEESLNSIYEDFKDGVLSLDKEQRKRMAQEEGLYSMIEKESLNRYFWNLGDQIRLGVTKQYKLIEI